jgi:hypothetical protein
MWTTRVVSEINVVQPRIRTHHVGIFGTLNRGVTTVGELGLRTRATIGAFDQMHVFNLEQAIRVYPG